MKMYFHLTCDQEAVLFENWVVTKGENLAISCFFIFLIGFFYSAIEQALTCLRKSYTKKLLKSHQNNNTQNDDEASLLQTPNLTSNNKIRVADDKKVYLNFPFKNCYLNIGYLTESILLAIYYFYAYAMMLIFMTYQVHMCVALCIGLAAGFFFITGWQRPIGKINENNGQVENVENENGYHNCCT